MFSTMSVKSIPTWTKCMKHSTTHKIKRLFSGQSTINQSKPKTLLQQKILKEHDYVLPYLYLIQSPGKLVSTKLINGFNKWLEIPQDKVDEITDISQTLHHCTVLIDDIFDKGVIRRDLPAANTIFTVGNTLSAGSFIYFLTISAAHQLGHPKAAEVLIDNLIDCHRGQAMEVTWTENMYVPTLEEYEQCVTYKTAGAYSVPVKLMQLFSNKEYDFTPLMLAFSKYFQIRDDYQDLIGIDHTTPSDDIATGRYTYLIIHALRNNPDDYQIKRILQLETKDHNIKKYLVSLLEKYGTLEHTRLLLQKLEKEFRDEIRKLGGSPKLEEVADYLSESGNYNN